MSKRRIKGRKVRLFRRKSRFLTAPQMTAYIHRSLWLIGSRRGWPVRRDWTGLTWQP